MSIITEFNPNIHKVKYFCHFCNDVWFGKNQFDDLCPHCEEIDFTFTFITEDDVLTYKSIRKTIDGFKKCIEDMERESTLMTWKKDEGIRLKI